MRDRVARLRLAETLMVMDEGQTKVQMVRETSQKDGELMWIGEGMGESDVG
jgi:hypothetical protein